MEDPFRPVWAKANSEEQEAFYEGSFANFITRIAPNSSEGEQARSLAREVASLVSLIVKIYGMPGEEKNAVVKCGIPEDNNGNWIMDVNFTINGIFLQIVVQDKSFGKMEDKFVERIKNVQLREEISRASGKIKNSGDDR
jgi:hypothetical protein